jgi:hypothetical protein
MLDDAVLLENAIEHFERSSAIDHEIFRDDLEPVDDRFLFENVAIVRHAKSDADAVIRLTIKCVRGHVSLCACQRNGMSRTL